jgi:sugar lactone lactonase YvrE
MLAHLALAIAPILPAATPTPHTLTAMAPIEVWARGLGDVRGIAVDAAGAVWVTDAARGVVLRLDAGGSARVMAAGLGGPIGIALDASGRVLVAEAEAGRIVEVAAGGVRRVIASGLDRPRWLAIADDGVIYVSAQRRTKEGDAEDAEPPGVIIALREPARPEIFLSGLRDPEGVAIHGGMLYAATRDLILRAPLAGAAPLVGERVDGTPRKPVGLAVDAAGATFVAAHRAVLGDEHISGVIAKMDEAAAVDLFASGADDPQGLAFDRDGNLYLAERRSGLVVRFVAPRVPDLAPLPAWTSGPAVTLSGRAEADARVEAVTGDGVVHAFAGDSGAFTLTVALLPNAVNEVAVRAIGHDGAGLTSPTLPIAITQDASPPMLALESPPTGAVVRGTVTVRARAVDTVSQLARIELSVAGQALPASLAPALPTVLATASAAWSSASAPDGIHTLTARATDRAGNTTSVSRTLVVDNTPPVTEIAGPETTPTGLRFTFTGRDNLTPDGELEFAWRVDGGAWSPFSSATAALLSDLPPGQHRIEAKARDRAGNEDTPPAALVFTRAGGALDVRIVEPVAGAVIPAGSALVRGTIDAAAADVGLNVNGLPGWRDGSAFTAIAEIDPDTTAIIVTAVSSDGRTGRASIPITVAAAPAVTLVATPWSGVAPLSVRFSLSRDPAVTTVALDADGDGVIDGSGPALDEQVVTYTKPGVYVARAVITDVTGAVTTSSTVVHVFDAAALDSQLRATWSAMRDALRRGDIATGVSHIVQRRRADYATALQLLGTSLPAIDGILTDLTPVRVRNASAVYEMRRTDDGLPKSFEIRFAIDGDGIWRLEAF